MLHWMFHRMVFACLQPLIHDLVRKQLLQNMQICIFTCFMNALVHPVCVTSKTTLSGTYLICYGVVCGVSCMYNLYGPTPNRFFNHPECVCVSAKCSRIRGLIEMSTGCIHALTIIMTWLSEVGLWLLSQLLNVERRRSTINSHPVGSTYSMYLTLCCRGWKWLNLSNRLKSFW